MTALELLQNLNLLDENEKIEAKRASDVGKSIMETICAFANEPGLGGGWILLGIAREELALFPAYEVEGIADPDRITNDIATQCRNMFNIPLRVTISTENVRGKNIIVIFAPEAQPQTKPIFFKSQGLPKGAFRRIGSTDQHCTEDDLLVFYQDRQMESFDASIVVDATFDDFSLEAITDYRKSRADTNPEAEELRWSDQDLLRALGCIRQQHGEWKPTVAGLILFGSSMALRRCFSMTRVDYIRVPGREWVPNLEHSFDTIELRDSLFRLIRRAQAAVLDDLPKHFGLKEGELQRQDKPLIPLRVIREALVNALMHRSYRSHSPVQIIRYANRLEISNPGFSLKSPEHLGEPGSEPRNPKIAAVLHETRFAETKGSGIRIMREGMEQAGLTPPLFESDRSKDKFIARYFFHHFLSAEDIAWLAQFRDLHLSDEEAKALILVREAGAIDNATYRDLNKVDALAASSALKRLRDAGLLNQKGKASATYYLPTERIQAHEKKLQNKLLVLPDNLQGLPTNLDPLSDNPNTLPDNLSDQDTVRQALLAKLPGELAAAVGGLGRRSPPSEVRTVIITICGLRPWKTEELALLLRRNPRHIRAAYLRPLVTQGELVMTNPTEPNDPQQAYRTVMADKV